MPKASISYDSRQVALMVKIATHLDADFARGVLSPAQRRLTACGRMRPKPGVLQLLNLTETGGKFVWHPEP